AENLFAQTFGDAVTPGFGQAMAYAAGRVVMQPGRSPFRRFRTSGELSSGRTAERPTGTAPRFSSAVSGVAFPALPVDCGRQSENRGAISRVALCQGDPLA